jgi:hypothetical protein
VSQPLSAQVRKTKIVFPKGIFGSTEFIGGLTGPASNMKQLVVYMNLFPLDVPMNKSIVRGMMFYHSVKIGIQNSLQWTEMDSIEAESDAMDEMEETCKLLKLANISCISNNPSKWCF